MAQPLDDQFPPVSGGHDDGSVTVAELLARMSHDTPGNTRYSGETRAARRARQAAYEENSGTVAPQDVATVMPPRRAQPQRVDRVSPRPEASTPPPRAAASRHAASTTPSCQNNSDNRVTDYSQSADYRARAGAYSQPLDTVSAADLAAAEELMAWPDLPAQPTDTREDNAETTPQAAAGWTHQPSHPSAGAPSPTTPARPRRSWILNDDDTQDFARPTLAEPPASNVQSAGDVQSAGNAQAATIAQSAGKAQPTSSAAPTKATQPEYFITAGMDSLGPVAADELEREIEESRRRYAHAVATPSSARPASARSEATSPEATSPAPARPEEPTAETSSSHDATQQHKPQSRIRAAFHNLTKRDADKEQITPADRILQVGQIIITAVAGGLLFWLFGILWGRPSLHILTFGLALAVQVVMVVAARLLRRREEFWVLIFTWAVAFFVTIGPIALVPH